MNNTKNTFPVKKYIFSFVATTVVTLAMMGICAVIFSFFPPGEKLLNINGIVWRCFSAFLAAFLCARVTRRKGLATGVISAFIYEFIMVVPWMLMFFDFSFSGLCVFMALSVLCGAVGGIMGINLK